MARFVLVVSLFAAVALAQEETVTLRPPPYTARASGELAVYMPDGGCMCQPVSRLPAPPYECNGTCGASRLRTRAALADAVDGGALNL